MNSLATRTNRYFPDMPSISFVWKSCKEVAEEMSVNERTVRRWCARGEVEAELLPGGKDWRVKCRESDGFPVRK